MHPIHSVGYALLHAVNRISGKTQIWVIGTTPAPNSGKLVYAMEVTKTLLFGQYFDSPDFQHKKPEPDNIYGDNIYRETAPGKYGQKTVRFLGSRTIEVDHSLHRIFLQSEKKVW